MTKPTARVLTLLEILQPGGHVPVRDLADRLEVDERGAPVRRPPDRVEHAGAFVRGRYGGYRLGPVGPAGRRETQA